MLTLVSELTHQKCEFISCFWLWSAIQRTLYLPTAQVGIAGFCSSGKKSSGTERKILAVENNLEQGEKWVGPQAMAGPLTASDVL